MIKLKVPNTKEEIGLLAEKLPEILIEKMNQEHRQDRFRGVYSIKRDSETSSD